MLGSLGGALAVADNIGGATGALLSHATRSAFLSGLEISCAVGGIVAFAGVLVVARLGASASLTIPSSGTTLGSRGRRRG